MYFAKGAHAHPDRQAGRQTDTQAHVVQKGVSQRRDGGGVSFLLHLWLRTFMLLWSPPPLTEGACGRVCPSCPLMATAGEPSRNSESPPLGGEGQGWGLQSPADGPWGRGPGPRARHTPLSGLQARKTGRERQTPHCPLQKATPGLAQRVGPSEEEEAPKPQSWLQLTMMSSKARALNGLFPFQMTSIAWQY